MTMVVNDICPIGNTLDVFNRKWIFCIMSNIYNGKTHFNEFKQMNPTISNHVLSQTLKYMEEQGLVIKTITDEIHNKTEYALTEKGLKTNRILYEITDYFFNEIDTTRSEEEVNQLLSEYREVYGI